MFGTTNSQPPPEKKVANIDADQLATNQQAIPVPYLAGRRRCQIHFISPPYNKRTEKVTAKTGKDESTTVGQIYFMDFAGVFCLGGRAKVNRLYKIIIDGQILWTGNLLADSDPYEPVTVPDRGLTRIYWGTFTQPIDDLVLTPIGDAPSDPDFDPRDQATWPGADYTSKPL